MAVPIATLNELFQCTRKKNKGSQLEQSSQSFTSGAVRSATSRSMADDTCEEAIERRDAPSGHGFATSGQADRMRGLSDIAAKVKECSA